MLVLSLLLAACSGASDDTASALVGDATAGAALYTTNCSSCHGADGEGVSGPAMAEIASEFDDAGVEDAIVNGTDGGMPAFPSLTAQDVADLVAYVRSFE